ncbi:SETMAR [Cordylochernes scorpioides]|uniref:SETMAR n=1 Tax=Cordylochernes scorpioides TaxID=51811 RepID=A0ABY6LQ64_9ARAC|nr:SETMAR [Cordylochernes scorpioides]
MCSSNDNKIGGVLEVLLPVADVTLTNATVATLLEIRIILLHEFKLGHNAAETIQNVISAWGKGTTSECTTRRWFEKFLNGDTSLGDEEGRGRLSLVDNDQLRAIIEVDACKTTREVAEELNVDQSTIVHLTQIGKVKKLDKWVQHDLNDVHKNRRFKVSSALLLRNKNEPFLDRIVTCDEKWILYYNRRCSAQWLDRDVAPKHLSKPKSHQKVIVTVWWSTASLIHHSFLNPGETITGVMYCQQIDKMHQKLRRSISTLQLVKKLDRYPFRKKRKIDSVEQEETTMNIKKEATNQKTQPVASPFPSGKLEDASYFGANGKIVRPKGGCTLKLDLNGLQESFEFVVMEDCSHKVILGWDFLKLSRAIIDSADDTLFLEKCLFEDTPKNSSPLYSELEYRIEPASIQLIEVASRDIPNDAIVVVECRKELLLERELTSPSSIISLTSNRDDFEEHLGRLQLVLNCLKKAGLCLNSKKCKFGAKTITVLGHEVGENGIRPDQEKIGTVRDFATPRSLKEVRSFLGLSSYYRRFIPNYAHVAQPSNDLLKKDSAFNWNREEQNAFEALKSTLISEPALGHFDYSSPTEIHTDASNYGIRAVLVKIQKGKERVIAYASRTLNKAEKNIQPQKGNALPSFGLSINSDHMSLDSRSLLLQTTTLCAG